VTERKFITFSAGGHNFAVPIKRIREVVTVPSVFTVPAGRKPLLGIIPYRGKEALPVFSLLNALGNPETREGDLIVVADFDGALAGFTVGELGGIITASGAEEEEESYQGDLEAPDGVITGVLREAGKEYIRIEIDRVFGFFD